MNSTPASRLQLQPGQYDSSMQAFRRSKAKIEAGDKNMPTLAWSMLLRAEEVSRNSYLLGHWKRCAEWSRNTGDACLYYLMGDWKNEVPTDEGTIDPGWWFEGQPCGSWVVYLAYGLGWGGVGRHWDLVSRILEFPQPKIGVDDEGLIAHDYYIGLARWWHDETDLTWIKAVKNVGGAGSKAYHLLCDAVMAISSCDESAIATTLTQCVQHFLKRRSHKERFPMAATFLWNVALLKGRTAEIPEDTVEYLFVLPEGL